MPWTSSDSSRHKKGLNQTQSRAWAEIADKARSSGKSDASAIRIANAAAPRTHHSRHYASNMAKYGPKRPSKRKASR